MRTALWALFGLAAACAAGMALWARNTYASVEATRYYFYGLQGYPVMAAERAAMLDAQAAIGAQVTVAWVAAGLALVLLLGAIVASVVRSERTKHDATGERGEHSPQAV